MATFEPAPQAMVAASEAMLAALTKLVRLARDHQGDLSVTLPDAALQSNAVALLEALAESIRQGHAITVVPDAALISRSDAAKILGIPATNLDALIKSGELEASNGEVAFVVGDVLALLRRMRERRQRGLAEMNQLSQATGLDAVNTFPEPSDRSSLVQ